MRRARREWILLSCHVSSESRAGSCIWITRWPLCHRNVNHWHKFFSFRMSLNVLSTCLKFCHYIALPFSCPSSAFTIYIWQEGSGGRVPEFLCKDNHSPQCHYWAFAFLTKEAPSMSCMSAQDRGSLDGYPASFWTCPCPIPVIDSIADYWVG